MLLKDKIKNDLKEAMKAKRELETSVLRMTCAAITNEEIAKGKKEAGLAEEEIIDILSREIKKRRESVSQYEAGGRAESAQKEKEEIEIISKYLPAQLSHEEIEKLAKEAIAQAGAPASTEAMAGKKSEKDFGQVMKILSPQIKGRADGKMVSEIVRKLLAS